MARDGAGTGIPGFLRLPEDNRVLGEEKQTPSVSIAAHTVDKLPLFHRKKETEVLFVVHLETTVRHAL